MEKFQKRYNRPIGISSFTLTDAHVEFCHQIRSLNVKFARNEDQENLASDYLLINPFEKCSHTLKDEIEMMKYLNKNNHNQLIPDVIDMDYSEPGLEGYILAVNSNFTSKSILGEEDLIMVKSFLTSISEIKYIFWGDKFKNLSFLTQKDNDSGFQTFKARLIEVKDLYPDRFAQYSKLDHLFDTLAIKWEEIIKERFKQNTQTLCLSKLNSDHLKWSTESIKLLNWNHLIFSLPVYDFANLMISSFMSKDKLIYEDDLLLHYHSELENRRIENYSFDDCMYDYHLSIIKTSVDLLLKGHEDIFTILSDHFNKYSNQFLV